MHENRMQRTLWGPRIKPYRIKVGGEKPWSRGDFKRNDWRDKN